MPKTKLNEQEIIQRFFSRPIKDSSVIQGIGDDAAIINPQQGHQLVVTTDTMVEDTHFVRGAPAYEVGYKLMAVNLSDLASMGAAPRWAFLNTTLVSIDEDWLSEFSKGLKECADKHNVSLIGGDTTQGRTLTLSLQLIGEVPEHKSLLRSNVQTEDYIFVTGKIGSAMSALSHLHRENNNHEKLTQHELTALYRPPSRIQFAIELRDLAHAAIDISDGLLHDLEILCRNSNVGAAIDIDKLNIEENISSIEALTCGEDYELIFTANANNESKINELAKKHKCILSNIGKALATNSIQLFEHGKKISYPSISGYDHFS